MAIICLEVFNILPPRPNIATLRARVCIRQAFGVNPRDADHSDLKLAPNGARVTIASGLCLHRRNVKKAGEEADWKKKTIDR